MNAFVKGALLRPRGRLVVDNKLAVEASRDLHCTVTDERETRAAVEPGAEFQTERIGAPGHFVLPSRVIVDGGRMSRWCHVSLREIASIAPHSRVSPTIQPALTR